MKTMVFGCLLVLSVTPSLAASKRTEYKPATVVSVQKKKKDSYTPGLENWSDAPLEAPSYTYTFDLRQGCTEYFATYYSWNSRLARIYSPQSPVMISVRKHEVKLMQVGDDKEDAMRLFLTHQTSRAACAQSGK